MITEDQVLDLGVGALDIMIAGHRLQTKPWIGIHQPATMEAMIDIVKGIMIREEVVEIHHQLQ